MILTVLKLHSPKGSCNFEGELSKSLVPINHELYSRLCDFQYQCHKLIYNALTLCKHACKVDCEVKSGIDPESSLGEPWLLL